MSQCYRVSLKASVSRIVKGEDSISYPIELTRILPPEEMIDLFRNQLRRSGWKAENAEESIFTREASSGESWVIDLDKMELTASIALERQVTAEANVTTMAESRKAARIQAENLLKSEENLLGDKILDIGNRKLQDEVTAQLNETEAARQRQINELLQQVYAESLKIKAGQLGEIMEISESTSPDGNYELTIRIEQ